MPKKPVLRSCAICRRKSEKKDLLRVVRAPDGTVLLDLSGKKPGRGAYLCANEECIVQARQTGRLSKVLEADIPDTLFDEAMEAVTHAEK